MWRLLAVFALLAPPGARAAAVVFSSGRAQVALVELFTSEGCSSCPPAEAWLARQRANPGLWRTFVPVAWHVTYWNRLGWPDPFARKAFTEREYAYAARWHSESVYTPCLVRNGVEWRPGRPAGAGPAAGILRVRYDPQTGALRAEFRPTVADLPGPLEVHAVQLGGGIVSHVRAGENAGRTLKHEFVALAATRGELAAEGGVWRVRLSFSFVPDRSASRRALAAWVTRGDGLTPLQATGGWIEPRRDPE